MPSLINLLDLKGNYSSIGKNIFDSEKGYAIVKEGSLVNFFNSKGYLQHSLNRILDYKLLDNIHDESTLRDMEMLLTSYDHLTYLLLSNNRWKSHNIKN